jgi:hypothetical protein
MSRTNNLFQTSDIIIQTKTASDERVAADDYWHSLIGEKIAAEFLDLSARTLQGLRQKGNGPHFIRLSARSTKYRRADLKAWAEKHVRISTSDNGSGE